MPKTSNFEIELIRDSINEVLDYLIAEQTNQGKKTTLRNFKSKLN